MQTLVAYMLVGAGGAVGCMLRFAVGRLFGQTSLPWATLTVNVAGGLAMGVLAGLAIARGGAPWWPLLGIGLLGGFTTFSAFSLELALMLERGAWGTALSYALASVLLALVAVFAGLWLTRNIG